MYKDELVEMGYTIRRLRVERSLTLAELSEKTGIQMATLSRIENNKMVGTLDTFNTLAETFRMKLSELIHECEKDQLEAFEEHLVELMESGH